VSSPAQTSSQGTEWSSDHSLVRCFRSGEGTAANLLYLRYVDRLRAVARSKIPRDLTRFMDVDDLVQSVFRRFFEAASDGRYDSPTGDDFWRLLVAIAANRVRTEITYQRAAKRDGRRTDNNCDVNSVLHKSHEGELELVVKDAMAQMPEDVRHVVLMRMEGYEVLQIAEMTGRSKRTTERLLSDARKFLKDLTSEPSDQGNPGSVGQDPEN
jgi:RNA polymerase sigma factor (sigma-70 family)